MSSPTHKPRFWIFIKWAGSLITIVMFAGWIVHSSSRNGGVSHIWWPSLPVFVMTVIAWSVVSRAESRASAGR